MDVWSLMGSGLKPGEPKVKKITTLHPEAVALMTEVSALIMHYNEMRRLVGAPNETSYDRAVIENAPLSVVSAIDTLRWERKGSPKWNSTMADLRKLRLRIQDTTALMFSNVSPIGGAK